MLVLANMGVPMLALVGPVMLIGLVPVILVEGLWLKYRFALLGWDAVRHSAVANLFSTLVGIPLTWVVLVLVQALSGGDSYQGPGWLAITWQAPWLLPNERELGWMIPAAALVLCVPFFLASVAIEGTVLKRRLLRPPERRNGTLERSGARSGLRTP